MSKQKLALILAGSMAAVVAVDGVLALALAEAHRPYLLFLASAMATTPGFVIAALAWRGKLPSRCKTA